MRKFDISGMSCAACSARVEKAVSSLSGVDSCSVNLLTNSMTVEGEADDAAVISDVKKAGYGARLAGVKTEKNRENDNNSLQNSEKKAVLQRLISSTVILIPLMYISMGVTMLGFPLPAFLPKSPLTLAIYQLLLSGIILVINKKFFVNGIKGALHLAPNMDTLVSLGSLASYGYSFAMLIAMSGDILSGGDGRAYLHELYFESAAMILALITLGKMLEARAKGKTTDALKGLVALKGKYATLVTDDGEKVISVDDIKIGDILAVKPGESIPTDGDVVSGEGAVDESMLTGESLPRDVVAGESVYGGSINKSGYITIRATKVGEGTVLANIIKMVSHTSATDHFYHM